MSTLAFICVFGAMGILAYWSDRRGKAIDRLIERVERLERDAGIDAPDPEDDLPL